MTQFIWLSRSISPPARWDLRYLGWSLRELDEGHDAVSPCPILLDWRSSSRPENWRELAQSRWTMAVGVDDSNDRATLLAQGLGEVLPTNVAMVELMQRALRLGDNAEALKRHRLAGPVVLDLIHRDGRIGRQWLGMHPREFGLMWRLAERPGERVTRRQLLSDVWRIEHEPETNSVEVHISRLRAKLAISHAAHLVVTDPEGGYRLAADAGTSQLLAAQDAATALDRTGEMGDDNGTSRRGN